MSSNLIQPIIRSITRPVFRTVFTAIKKAIMDAISAYRFDGFDDYAVLAYRAINPDGDIDIEFWSPSRLDVYQQIVSQNITNASANAEFSLESNASGSLILRIGGLGQTLYTQAAGYKPNTRYRLFYSGSTWELYESGTLIRSLSFTRGAAREPNAVTVIGAFTAGVIGTYSRFFQGIQRDIKINGILYPISDRNQSIQLPSPSNLGVELITQTVLENPAVKGTQWTYLGNGRWQYIGDGTLNALQFLSSGSQPESGFLEFEIESINGQLNCTSGNNSPAVVFNTIGVKRYFYTAKGSSNENTFLFKRHFSGVGTVTSCIIKNISFKPLATVSSTELVSNGDFSAGTTGWSSTGSATFSVNSGQASVGYVAGQNSRVTQSLVLEAGKYYEVTADVASITGVTSAILRVIRGSEGGFADVAEASISTSGKLRFLFMARASDASIGLRADQTNNGTIVWDNVSVRKVDLCNPLTLVNANDFWWSTVGAASRDVYVFDGVDDRTQLTYRAINIENDIDIEWMQVGSVNNRWRTVVSQNISSDNSREFSLSINNSNKLVVIIGGSTHVRNEVDCSVDGKYRLNVTGSLARVFFNDIEISSFTANRGTVREPTALTVIGGRANGSTTSFLDLFAGLLYNVKINGVLYKMADRNQAIQLPEPSGLGAELITPSVLENPAVNGSQWTYLGGGRWQYVGDGSFNALEPLSTAATPTAGYLEFEVESISGQMSCTRGNLTRGRFSSVGVFRYFYTDINEGGTNNAAIRFTRATNGQVVSCIIKNISFKPLTVVNATELVTNGDFSAGTTGWGTAQGGSISVTGGQATLTTTANSISRFERSVTLEPSAYYEISCDLISFSGNNSGRLALIRSGLGNFSTIISITSSTAGKLRGVFLAPASDGIVQIHGDAANAGTVVVDNVSIRKLDSLCNPMQLINTTSDRWREIDK